MLKPKQFHPRDLIAILILTACFILIGMGVDSFVTAITTLIVGYYFSKRVYEEKNPNGDLNEKVKKLEEDVKPITQNQNIQRIIKQPIFQPGHVVVKPPILF